MVLGLGPKVKCVISTFIQALSLWKLRAPFGATLLNLTIKPPPSILQSALYILGIPILAQLRSRWEALYNLLWVANFVVFLLHGDYPTVLHRVLRLRLHQRDSNLEHTGDTAFMRRQIAWQTFTELSLIAMPLWRRYRSRVQSFWRLQQPQMHFSGGMALGYDRDASEICSSCGGRSIATPYQLIPCGHCYCYCCTYEVIQETCKVCDARVSGARSL